MVVVLPLFAGFISCAKLVQVAEPTASITTVETFSTIANATSAITGIYSSMSYYQQSQGYANCLTTINCGMSADELLPYNFISYFQINQLLPDGEVYSDFWAPIYSDIYKSNAAIEGIQASLSLPAATRNQLTGEAKFIRAFGYFYLINLFGNVPLVTTSAWNKTSLLSRTPLDTVYNQIIQDLIDAQHLLGDDYSFSGGERIRANIWVATALLARVYLYKGDWANAEIQSTKVIDNSAMFSLVSELDSAFLKNNNEAIFQLQLINQTPYATNEGNQFVPYDSTSSPNYILTPQLLAAFEPGDDRRKFWVDSTDYSGTYYYYPYKYKVRQGTSGNIGEYYTLLRLAEQYLIRGEARAQQKTNLIGAIADIDTIRKRAGLEVLPNTLDEPQILQALAQENRIEFFAEWGHRWFDLKRTGQADAVLAPIKSQWKSSAQLYPIPVVEIQVDPNLVQNPGYH